MPLSCVHEAFNTSDQGQRDELLVPIFKVVCGTGIIRACLIPIRNFSLEDLDGFETRMGLFYHVLKIWASYQ